MKGALYGAIAGAFVAVLFGFGCCLLCVRAMDERNECRAQLDQMRTAARDAQTIAQKAVNVARLQYAEKAKATEEANDERQKETEAALEACPDWRNVAIPERLRGVLSY